MKHLSTTVFILSQVFKVSADSCVCILIAQGTPVMPRFNLHSDCLQIIKDFLPCQTAQKSSTFHLPQSDADPEAWACQHIAAGCPV